MPEEVESRLGVCDPVLAHHHADRVPAVRDDGGDVVRSDVVAHLEGGAPGVLVRRGTIDHDLSVLGEVGWIRRVVERHPQLVGGVLRDRHRLRRASADDESGVEIQVAVLVLLEVSVERIRVAPGVVVELEDEDCARAGVGVRRSDIERRSVPEVVSLAAVPCVYDRARRRPGVRRGVVLMDAVVVGAGDEQPTPAGPSANQTFDCGLSFVGLETLGASYEWSLKPTSAGAAEVGRIVASSESSSAPRSAATNAR